MLFQFTDQGSPKTKISVAPEVNMPNSFEGGENSCIEIPETIIDHIAGTTVSIKQNLTQIEDAVKSVCQGLSKDTIPTGDRCPSPSYSPIHGTDHVNHSSPEISFDEAPIASMEETTETQCNTKPSKLRSPNS